MARFYPNRISVEATRGERFVFERLHDLDDSWYVLHSVSFVAQERRGPRVGEIDFVLLNIRVGMLVLEVKDGTYEIEGRSWFALRNGNRERLSKSPFEQAVDNRYKLARWIKNNSGVQVPSGHCVVFTDGRPNGQLGPEGPAAITLTGQSLNAAREAIGTVVEHWRVAPWTPSVEDFESVLTALAPTASVAPTLDYVVDVAAADMERLTEHQIRLTNQQLDVVAATSSDSASLVLGAAGTGKTLLALQRAQLVSRSGAKVGLVCGPKHLRLEFRRKLQSQGALGDPRDLLASLHETAGGVAPVGQEPWEDALHLVEKFGPQLDCLIIDEAQNYEPMLLEALRELVHPNGTTIFFADPYQRDSTGTWRPQGGLHEYWLTENCRNTLPIARLVARLSGALPPVADAPGLRPQFVTEEETTQALAVSVIKDLAVRLPPSKIVVLTRSDGHRTLRADLGRAGLPLQTQVGDEGVLVCSVEEFRGCEAPAIVYVANEPPASDRTSDYIATSRACSHLTVVGRAQEWQDQSHLFAEAT